MFWLRSGVLEVGHGLTDKELWIVRRRNSVTEGVSDMTRKKIPRWFGHCLRLDWEPPGGQWRGCTRTRWTGLKRRWQADDSGKVTGKTGPSAWNGNARINLWIQFVRSWFEPARRSRLPNKSLPIRMDV